MVTSESEPSALLRWDDGFFVHVSAADYEHRKMIELINSLHSGWVKGGRAETAKFLDDLVNVLGSHFAVEDGLMISYDYDQRDIHAADHDLVVAKVRRLAAQARDPQFDLSGGLALCLQDWFASHIRNHDARMYMAFQLHRWTSETRA